MLPFLFQGTSFETPTYYVLYLLAFLGAIMMGTYRAQDYKLSPVRAVDLGVVIFLSGVFGARLLHIFFEEPAYYLKSPLQVFYLWQGGFVLFGGIIGSFLGGAYFLKLKREPFALWADVVAPCFLLGLGIGRMGCLSAGCCFGSETTWPWGIVFSDPNSAAPLHILIHPTQILESFFGFAGAALIWFTYKARPKRPGVIFCYTIISYAIFRFLIEFIRGDSSRGVYGSWHISTSQIISVAAVIAASLWLVKLKKA